MSVRHDRKTCEICGLPGGSIKEYTHPARTQLTEAHPTCVSADHVEVIE